MSKAAMLRLISDEVVAGRVPPFRVVRAEEWLSDREGELDRIRRSLPEVARVAVRSSAADEDGPSHTNAGKYLSVLGVGLGDDKSLAAALDRVVADMARKSSHSTGHSVIVQSMVTDAAITGVATTIDITTGAPYLVLSYEFDGPTDSITSGSTNPTFVALHDWRGSDSAPDGLTAVLRVAQEVSRFLDGREFDMEFVVDRTGTVNILQVRGLPPIHDSTATTSSVRRKSAVLRRVTHSTPLCLSDMADWNPAEMIGESPRPLAYSLYRDFITRRTWRSARRALGYHDPVGRELMCRVGARPFIDVAASLASLVPATVPPTLRNTLVRAGVERVRSSPETHDSVEFTASVSTAGLATARTLTEVFGDALRPADRNVVREHLRWLTNNLVSTTGLRAMSTLADRLARLEHHAALTRPGREPGSWLRSAAFQELSQTLPVDFAVAARHGFIARSLVDEVRRAGGLTDDRLDEFRSSLRTITAEFLEAGAAARRSSSGRDAFRARFGHLRAGTYDIRSLPYSAHPDLAEGGPPLPATPSFDLSRREASDLTTLLRSSDLLIPAAGLLDYLRQAIRLREFAKFVYSKFVSVTLEAIASWSGSMGLSREDASFLPLRIVLRAVRDAGFDRHWLADELVRRREHHRREARVITPSVIRAPEDLTLVVERATRPTFITDQVVRSTVRVISDLHRPGAGVSGTIVCAERADPGYDWLLAAGVRGIITRFGGPNSHLAVRCAELRLPAAIGCGKVLYQIVTRHGEVELDCSSRHIRTI
ncbi:PEP/pyruvate-binding domain-containing protein [Actinosynnema sp. NPDC051121]